MKYILVEVGPIAQFPPAMNVLQTLDDLNVEVILITNQMTKEVKEICLNRNIKYIEILPELSHDISVTKKIRRLFKVRKLIWKEINKIYDDNTVVWVCSDNAIKHLGKELLNKNYILHMYELSKKIRIISKLPFLTISTERYAKSALAVIQAEYNRSQISKIWWNLEKLPFILPNKPYENVIETKEVRDFEIEISKLSNRKIVLYQGVVSKERPLDNIIEAVNQLGDDYVFVLMSNKNPYEQLQKENYLYIPFVNPPEHLRITKHAFIGVLSYKPVDSNYSKLNALYCAPNKLFEYTSFGIPVIGNDVPGLKFPIEKFNMGAIYSQDNVNQIKKSILLVEQNYNLFSSNAKKYYNSVNVHEIIDNVLKEVNVELRRRERE
ncbi:hypothetical protein NGC53_04230 [Aerococcus viridans]|uniref:hypothetical protein n=1 Tax=Aerococcus viridans TaxID=1377 RepID=UPI002DBAFB7F|nr:hypothetical protein [Aerococcus viridans]MEB7389005.1 hypothetical protein [Aerococcus viridans]